MAMRKVENCLEWVHKTNRLSFHVTKSTKTCRHFWNCQCIPYSRAWVDRMQLVRLENFACSSKKVSFTDKKLKPITIQLLGRGSSKQSLTSALVCCSSHSESISVTNEASIAL